jgi:hypothetical protein
VHNDDGSSEGEAVVQDGAGGAPLATTGRGDMGGTWGGGGEFSGLQRWVGPVPSPALSSRHQ